jgi:hypothetical protein
MPSIYESPLPGAADTVSFRELARSGDEDEDDPSDGSPGVSSDSESQSMPYFVQRGIRRRPLPPAHHPVPDTTDTQVRDTVDMSTLCS